MLILALDTSAGTSVALVEADASVRTRAVRRTDNPRHHAELAAPMIVDVLAEAGSAASDVDLVVVGTGPAPFTGLRVGLVTARAFAHARGIEVLGVPSLDALARTALDARPGLEQVVVVTDARRREVYGGRFETAGADDVRALDGPVVQAPGRVLEDLDGRGLALTGAGTRLYPDALPDDGLPEEIDPVAAVRIALARREARLAGRPDVPSLDTEPLYLRRPDVHTAGAAHRG